MICIFLSNIIILLTNYTITYFSYTNKMMQCGLDIVTKNKKTIHHVQHGCYFLSHHTLVYESFSVFTLLSKKSLKIPKGGNQNPYIKEEQTTQWPKENAQKDKQRSTKHTYKTKYRVTRTPLKIRGELMCSGRVGSSCSTSVLFLYR